MDGIGECEHFDRKVTPWPFNIIIDSRPMLVAETIDPLGDIFIGENAPLLDISKHSAVITIVRRFRCGHFEKVELKRAFDRIE